MNVEEGRRLANELGAVAYVECSALTQEGVKNVFDEVTKREISFLIRGQLLDSISIAGADGSLEQGRRGRTTRLSLYSAMILSSVVLNINTVQGLSLDLRSMMILLFGCMSGPEEVVNLKVEGWQGLV